MMMMMMMMVMVMMMIMTMSDSFSNISNMGPQNGTKNWHKTQVNKRLEVGEIYFKLIY